MTDPLRPGIPPVGDEATLKALMQSSWEDLERLKQGDLNWQTFVESAKKRTKGATTAQEKLHNYITDTSLPAGDEPEELEEIEVLEDVEPYTVAEDHVVVTTDDPTGAIILESKPKPTGISVEEVPEGNEEDAILLESAHTTPSQPSTLSDFELDPSLLEDIDDPEFGSDNNLSDDTTDPFAPTDVGEDTPSIETPTIQELPEEDKKKVIESLKLPKKITDLVKKHLTQSTSTPEGYHFFFVEKLNELIDKETERLKTIIKTMIMSQQHGPLSADDQALLLDYLNRASVLEVEPFQKIKDDSILALYAHKMEPYLKKLRKLFTYRRA